MKTGSDQKISSKQKIPALYLIPHSYFKSATFSGGLVGNLLCIITFTLKINKEHLEHFHLSSTCTDLLTEANVKFVEDYNQRYFHHLMLALAVFDSIYILSALVMFAVPHILPRYIKYISNLLSAQGKIQYISYYKTFT